MADFEADQSWIIPKDWSGSGMVSRPDNTVAAEGMLELKPIKTTTYTLLARNRADEVQQHITVPVISQTGSCAISGTLKNDKKEYSTRVTLYPEGSNKLVASVNASSGSYNFGDVKAGQYRVVPTGNYPNGRLAIGPRPRFRGVICQPNQRHRLDFAIVSLEG